MFVMDKDKSVLNATGAGAVGPVCLTKPSTQCGLSVAEGNSNDISMLTPVKGRNPSGCKKPQALRGLKMEHFRRNALWNQSKPPSLGSDGKA